MDHVELPRIGWREWVGLPTLGVEAVKAKIDTGARSSSIHALDVHEARGRVRFRVAPPRAGAPPGPPVELPLFDTRSVRSSSGSKEVRHVVRVEVELSGQRWPIELTLAERASMRFRMLLGREAIRGRFLVDPGCSFVDPSRIPEGVRPTRWSDSHGHGTRR